MGNQKYTYLIFVYTVVTINIAEGRNDLPCTINSGECMAKVYETEQNAAPSLEVSCQCKYIRDVSRNLTALYPILCPGIPSHPNDTHLLKAILRIQNCDVEEQVFPLEILTILRRSKYFEILVENVNMFRTVSMSLSGQEDAHPEINALFKNSKISGFGNGWFTNAKKVDIIISNCSIGVLEYLFIGHYLTYSPEVLVQFTNSDIQTIKSYAIFLPPNGSLYIQGGKILQIENDALGGGRNVVFEAVLINRIQKSAINILGLHSFRMDSCIVAEIEEEAFVDKETGRSINSKYTCEEVIIILNKFINVKGKSFEYLCMANNLTFKDNFMDNVSSTLALKPKFCGTPRNWWESLGNNGFRCGNCNSLSGAINEQVCAIYATGWCLCDDKEVYNMITSIPKTETERKVPCKQNFKDYISNHCGHTNELELYSTHCGMYKEKVEHLTGRDIMMISSSGYTTKMSFTKIFLLTLIICKLF